MLPCFCIRTVAWNSDVLNSAQDLQIHKWSGTALQCFTNFTVSCTFDIYFTEKWKENCQLYITSCGYLI